MSYVIACISSRVATDRTLDRAKRLIKVLANTSITTPGFSEIYFRHTGTPFETEVADFFGITFGQDKVIKITNINKIKLSYVNAIRAVHPKPRKLSRKAFNDLCLVAKTIDSSHILIAAPIKERRGRAVVATKLAACNYLPYINLSSDEAEKRITKQEVYFQRKKDNIEQEVYFQRKKDDNVLGVTVMSNVSSTSLYTSSSLVTSSSGTQTTFTI